MRKSISFFVRRIAGYLEVDDTPTSEEIRKQRLEGESAIVSKGNNESDDKANGSKNHSVKSVRVPRDEKLKKTKRPDIKPPRRQSENSKKWNENTKTEKMRDYMKEYRQEKIFDTSGTKNVYRKKSINL